MAMIFCSHCGKQISDKAVACPKCGAKPQLPAQYTPVQQQTPVQQAPVEHQAVKSRKAPLIAGVLVSALVIAIIVIVLIAVTSQNKTGYIGEVSSNSSIGNYVPPTENNGNTPTKAIYDINLAVECKKNAVMNKYDVDILVDGKKFATLSHGTSKTYAFRLEEGSHSIEFRIASTDIFGDDIYDPNDKGTYQKKTFYVTENMSYSFYVKLVTGNDIEVEIK